MIERLLQRFTLLQRKLAQAASLFLYHGPSLFLSSSSFFSVSSSSCSSLHPLVTGNETEDHYLWSTLGHAWKYRMPNASNAWDFSGVSTGFFTPPKEIRVTPKNEVTWYWPTVRISFGLPSSWHARTSVYLLYYQPAPPAPLLLYGVSFNDLLIITIAVT